VRHSQRLVFAIGAVLAGAAAQAQQADSNAADPLEEATLEQVIVLGRGETRQSQSITAQQIEYLPPGTSPLKAIEKLPGVNFQSTDPYGAYEWSTRITVRGFNQNRLGFTLDGVPLGDMTYGNHNGLHISRAIPTELVGRTVLSKGTGAIDTASLSNLGGAVEFFSASPEQEVGATVPSSPLSKRANVRRAESLAGAGRCREKNRGETAHRSKDMPGSAFAAVLSFPAVSLPAPFLLSPV
jgi:iron complex outermembrane recepter protein